MRDFNTSYQQDKAGQQRILKAKFTVCYPCCFEIASDGITRFSTLAWMLCWPNRVSGVSPPPD